MQTSCCLLKPLPSRTHSLSSGFPSSCKVHVREHSQVPCGVFGRVCRHRRQQRWHALPEEKEGFKAQGPQASSLKRLVQLTLCWWKPPRSTVLGICL